MAADDPWSDLRKVFMIFRFMTITEELDSVSPPKTLTFSYDLVDGRHVWLVADTQNHSTTDRRLQRMRNWSQNKEEHQYGFYTEFLPFDSTKRPKK